LAIWKREANLGVGDLVYHILYGKSWLGMIISLEQPPSGSIVSKGRFDKVLVRMIPGSEHSDFFETRPSAWRHGHGRGWVSDHWLIKMDSQNVIED
tara:strand:- start:30 stop:317 length:288 start_codon:yes stop_codon:yes gene_type:complete